ncbi:MAG: uracil-DNA glycosylase family protein [Oscillospiraceae bacterium]
MANYKNIKEIVHNIHEINFGTNGVIRLDTQVDEKNYKALIKENNNFSKKISGYCTLCEENQINTPDETSDINRKEYSLGNISHGTHTFDFLEAAKLEPENVVSDNTWIDTPVLFLMENPSVNYYKMYQEVNLEKNNNYYNKRPTHKWYWLNSNWHTDNTNGFFDSNYYFKLGSYGQMVFSLIKQYKLANAYVTNIVKCGMSNAKNDVKKERALNTDYYKDACINKCIMKVLEKEINELSEYSNEVIVFAFGNRTYKLFHNAMKYLELKDKKIYLAHLPHPANHYISNDYRPFILKGVVEDVLECREKYLIKKNDDPKNTGESDSDIRKIIINQLKKSIIKEDSVGTINFGQRRTDNQFGLTISYGNDGSTYEIALRFNEKYTANFKCDDVNYCGSIGYIEENQNVWLWNKNDSRLEENKDFKDSFKTAIENAIGEYRKVLNKENTQQP